MLENAKKQKKFYSRPIQQKWCKFSGKAPWRRKSNISSMFRK